MQQALSLQDGGYKPFEIFDAFYAEDLVVFGIKHNIPEAVRLGELMLQENGAALSLELAKATKLYKLQHSEKYQGAMKKTGPVDFSKVYSNLKGPAHNGDKWSSHSIVNTEDPYWIDFFEKNYRTQDIYKLPSAMAWDYNPNGILDEILDFKELKRKAERARRLM